MSKRSRFTSSSNPALNAERFQRAAGEMKQTATGSNTMTMSGAVNKSILLTLMVFVSGGASWYAAEAGMIGSGMMYVGLFGGLIAAMVGIFKPSASPIAAPIYAIFEGIFLGLISLFIASAVDGENNGFFSGIVFQAVILTASVLLIMLMAWKSGLIKVTEKLRSGIVMATGAVFVVYMLSFVLGMFGVNIPYLHEGGIIGIGISLVIIGIAAFNLLLDFDLFEKGEQAGAPSYMEWYAAMGLLITLVWLYIEILRLLSMLSSD